ncbi:hypothetical protein MMPV_002532 [Pyropia vietnamensis]
MLAARLLVVGSGGTPCRLPVPPAPALPLSARPSSVPPLAGHVGRLTRLWLTIGVVCGSAVYLFASASWAALAGGGWTLVGMRQGPREATAASSSPAAREGPRGLPLGGDAVVAAPTRPHELGGGRALVSYGYALPARISAVSVGTLGSAGPTGGQGGPAVGTTTLVEASRTVEGVQTAPAAVAVAADTLAAALDVAAPLVDNTSATATGGVMAGAAPSAGSAASISSRRSLHGGDASSGSNGPVAASAGEAASVPAGHLLAAAAAADGVHLGGSTLAATASVGSSSATEAAVPPTSSVATVIGAVYVLNAAPCTDKLAWVRERARAAVGLDVPLTILPAVAGQDVSLDAPPLPVARQAVPADASVSGGQLAATASHRAAWRRTVAEGHPVVVVLEDDTFPTDELWTRLPALVQGLDLGAAAEETSWHVAYLSRHPLGAVAAEKTWWVAGAEDDASASIVAAVAGVPILPPRRLTVAGRSWGGTAAYLLTVTGARHLLAAVTTYTGPLDEALSDVPGLVVLSACNNDAPVHRCPENVVRAGVADMGGCAQPAAAVGERRLGRAFGEPRREERANAIAITVEKAIAAAAAVAGVKDGGVVTDGVAYGVGPAGRDAAAANEVMSAAAGMPGGVGVLKGAAAQGDTVSPARANNATARVVAIPVAPGALAEPAIAGAPDGAAATDGGVTPSYGTAGLTARDNAAVTADAAAAAVVAPDDDEAAVLEGIAEGEAAEIFGTALGHATAPNGAALASDGAETVAVAPSPPAAIRAHTGRARFHTNYARSAAGPSGEQAVSRQ